MAESDALNPAAISALESNERDPRLAATAALMVVHAALPVIAFISFYLAAYPAFVKFSPHGLADLAVPYRLGKQLEFMLYAVTFAILLPASVWTANLHVRALERRKADTGFVATLDVAAVTVIVAAARIAVSYAPPILDSARASRIRPISIAVLLAVIAVAAANVLVLRHPRLLPRVVLGDLAIPALVAMAIVPALVFMPKSVFTVAHGLAAAGVAFVLFVVWRWTAGRSLPSRLQPGLDVLSVILIALLVWNVRLPSARTLQILAYNHNVYLGPVNSVVHGATALVDVNPHYGPVLTYFLAGLFHLFPIGYGTFWIISTTFDVVLFIAMYGLLRFAGAGRLLSICGVVAIALTTVFSQGPNGTEFTMNPARSLRLFLPVFAIVAILLAERYPPRRTHWSWTLAAVVGLSSVWAIEVFFYTAVAVLAALVCIGRVDAPENRRFVFDRTVLGRIVAAVVFAQVVFAAATRILSGSWPNWVRYVQYDRAYSTGSVAQRYHWAPFGPGVLLGAFYFATVAATIVVLVWNRRFAREKRVLLIATCAVEGFAVSFYSYFAGVSELGTLNKMAPAAILLIVLVLALVANGRSLISTSLRAGFALLAVSCAATYLIAQPRWPTNLSHTALFAGPSATIDDIRTEANLPIVFPTAPDAVALLRRTIGRATRALVLMPDAQTTEILMRADKMQLLVPFADPYGDKQLPENVARLRRLAARLPVGTQFLSLARYYESSAAAAPAEIDAALIEELKRDFVIRTAAVGARGLRIYRLAALR